MLIFTFFGEVFFTLFGGREAGFFKLCGDCWEDYCKKEGRVWDGCRMGEYALGRPVAMAAGSFL